MNRENKIIILRGNSGSGKTTVAKVLQKRIGNNTLLLSQDVIRRDMLKVKDGPDSPAVNLLTELVKYGKDNCPVVILEGILYRDWYQPLFEYIKECYGNHVYAFYYDLSFEETLCRHITKPNAHEFGETEMKRWWREKDYVKIFPEYLLSSNLSVEDTADMILEHVYD